MTWFTSASGPLDGRARSRQGEGNGEETVSTLEEFAGILDDVDAWDLLAREWRRRARRRHRLVGVNEKHR